MLSKCARKAMGRLSGKGPVLLTENGDGDWFYPNGDRVKGRSAVSGVMELIEEGAIVPNHDALLEGMTQTYRLNTKTMCEETR